ncbi:MAG: hypothetical protein LBT43_13855 [Prevotella sp.]|jgi:hypothetical protein|nr:hypothetical protein [Prevotella sp.]
MARNMVLEEKDNIIYGEGGIKGDRFTEVAGWEKGTVGFAGNIYSRLASENGIQPVDPALTGAREPFKVGRFLIKILKTVPWFDKKVMYAWRYIIEDTAVSLSGIQNYTYDTFTRPHGVIRQTSAYGGIFKETNGEFQIKVPETAGQLVRKAMDYWFYGMSDPKTGVATFYGKDVRDLQPNKSMTILYALLGPTCRPTDIEYACIWHDAILTVSKHDHNNSDNIGEAGQGTDVDLSFNGIFDRGPQVDLLASLIVDREGLYEERSYNALLPQYMYDNYFKENGLAREDYNNTLAERLKYEVGMATEGTKAYSSSTSTTYNNIKDKNKDMFKDDDNAEPAKNGLGDNPGTFNPSAAFPF